MAYIQKRETASGEINWRVQVRLKGYPIQSATFQRKTDAKNWAQQIEAAMKEGRHFKTSESKRRMFSELADRYIKNILPLKPKSLKKQTAQLNWWKKQIGNYVLADITPSLIAEQRDNLLNEETYRGTKRSPATVVRYLAALSHAFSIAVKEWGWLESNPVSKIRKPKEPRGRVRFLSNDERNQLLQEIQKTDNLLLYLIVILCLSTGARRMEILGLRWKDIDFARHVIVLHQTKNGERRVLPIVGKAYELLLNHSNKIVHGDNDYVFPAHNAKKPMDIRTPWETALKHAGIKDFRFHDLRHSAASYLAMNGASLAEIAEVLGHKTLSMVKRYAHLSEAHTAKIVASMNEKIFGGTHDE